MRSLDLGQHHAQQRRSLVSSVLWYRSATRQGCFGLEHKDEDCCRCSKRIGVLA